MLRTSIRAPIPFPFYAEMHKAKSAWTDFLIAFAMDRKSIAERALLRKVLELRGCPKVAVGDPWGVK